jgi:hypothetical protein
MRHFAYHIPLDKSLLGHAVEKRPPRKERIKDENKPGSIPNLSLSDIFYPLNCAPRI